MAKIRLTKNELKKQKDALKRFNQYLPTLILKKQQLQVERLKVHKLIDQTKQKKAYVKAEVYKWVDVFNERVGVEDLLTLSKVKTSCGNIAGIDIPVLEGVEFAEKKYDPEKLPLWVGYGIEALKKMLALNAEIDILNKQEELIVEELRITTQRVNLFEKVMIPTTRENIRRIQIYLGDQQTAAVVTGKIAKEKITKLAHSRLAQTV
ncbi:MAG: V-type ATP synthase subunit D [Candidatus Omnitrophica bacterium]|nr:V-type ATP synthase subunit D [Candidatus Omnitrophota bacterium]